MAFFLSFVSRNLNFGKFGLMRRFRTNDVIVRGIVSGSTLKLSTSWDHVSLYFTKVLRFMRCGIRC